MFQKYGQNARNKQVLSKKLCQTMNLSNKKLGVIINLRKLSTPKNHCFSDKSTKSKIKWD